MAKGQFGARDLQKHLWKLPIPEFNSLEPLHVALSEAGQAAAEGAAEQLAKLRRELRKWLVDSQEGRAQFIVHIVSLTSLDRKLSLQPVEQLHRCGVQRLEAFRVGYAGVRFFGRPIASPLVSAHVIAPRQGYRRSPS